MKDEKQQPYKIEMIGLVATISIIGTIGGWDNWSEDFTQEVNNCLQAGCTNVELYINSAGGDVFDGAEIANQVKRFTGTKKAFLGAICASAATLIACECECEAMPNTLYMIHNPTLSIERASKQELESGVVLLQNIRESTLATYSKKTGKDSALLGKLMDATTWMSASKAKEMGFVDSINYGNVPVGMSAETYSRMSAEMSVDGVLVGGDTKQGDNKNSTKTKFEMNKQGLLAVLMMAGIALKDDAPDKDIQDAVLKLHQDKTAAEKALAEMKMSVANQKASLIVQNGIDQKKITEADRAVWMKDAIENPEMVERALAKIPAVAMASQIVPIIGMNGVLGMGEDTSKWTYREYSKKDPTGLMKLKDENPVLYAKLYFEEYGVHC